MKLAFGKLTLARGVVAGKLKGPANVALEFLEPLEAERNYDVVTSGKLRGCGSSRETVTKPVTFSDAGGGGGGGGGGGDLPGPGANVQGLSLNWSGGKFEGNDSAEVNIPGIGRAVAVCNPETTWLRVLPDDPNRSTAMLLYTYRESSFATFGSVREAVTTPFTGPDFNEGFNVDNPRPEATSKGTFTGVISDRLPFGATSGVAVPPTAGRALVGVELRRRDGVELQRPGQLHHRGARLRGAAGALADGQLAGRGGGRRATRLDRRRPRASARRGSTARPGSSGVRRFTLFPEAGVGPANFTSYEGSDVSQTTQTQGPYRFELPNNGLVTADFGGILGARPVPVVALEGERPGHLAELLQPRRGPDDRSLTQVEAVVGPAPEDERVAARRLELQDRSGRDHVIAALVQLGDARRRAAPRCLRSRGPRSARTSRHRPISRSGAPWSRSGGRGPRGRRRAR